MLIHYLFAFLMLPGTLFMIAAFIMSLTIQNVLPESS